MLQKIKLFFLIACISTNHYLYTQTIDSVQQIDTVLVSVEKSNLISAGSINQTFKNKTNESLSIFLNDHTNSYIKNYGYGSLSTLSTRGATASQSAVYWQGAPIKSPTLGLIDLSTISYREAITIQYGGSSSLNGSGAIGATINLFSNPDFNSKFNLRYSTSLASFSTINQFALIKFGNKKIQFHTSGSFIKSKNDFRYKASPSLPYQYQTNSSFQQGSFKQSLFYKHHSFSLDAHYWFGTKNTEIPPLLTQRKSEAKQSDSFHRFLVTTKYKRKKFKLSSSLSYFIERQYYEDPQSSIKSNNNFNHLSILQEYKQYIKHQCIIFSLRFNLYEANTNSYKRLVPETSLLAYSVLKFNSFLIQPSIRLNIFNSKVRAPIPFIGIDFTKIKNTTLKLKLSREFRNPTLNDLYWNPGGNKNLKPEQGWSQEISLVYQNKNKQSFHLSIFNRNINNWIMWYPNNKGFWEPQNISKVWSKGFDISHFIPYTKNNFSISNKAQFTLTSSTYLSSLPSISAKKGDQLLYLPIYMFSDRLVLKYTFLTFSYTFNLVSKTKGVNENIALYNLSNINIMYNLNQEKLNTSIVLKLNNIFNQSYIIVERRPMPLFNFSIGVNFKFKTK